MTTSVASNVFGSEALQSVAVELVIFCATIVVALALKVSSFNSGCGASFLKFWGGAQRPPPKKPRPHEDDECQKCTEEEMPSADAAPAASTRVGQTGGRKSGPRSAVQGPARTLESIMELAANKNAVEALSLYAEFYAAEGKQLQVLLRSVRRSGLDFYSALIQSAVRVGQPEMVEQLLDDMSSAHLERTLSFYESMMKVLAGKKHYRQALAVYNRLNKEGFKASPVTLSCLINFSAELGDLDSAIAFFEQLAATSKPSIRAYMVALRVYSKRQDWTKSVEIIRSMQNSDVPVDTLILNTVLATGVAAGKTEAAEELLHQMETDSLEVVDVISYNTVLKGYAHQKVADKPLAMLDLMLARGIKPNGITFNTVMDSAVRGGQIEDAWKVLERMQQENVRADKYTCTILMKALQENSTPKQLSKLIDMIQSVLPQCDSSLCGSLFHGIIQVAARLNNKALLMRVFLEMRGYHVTPTTSDFQLMIQTLAQQHDVENGSVIWRHTLAPATNGGSNQQQPPAAMVVAIFTSVMEDLAQKDHVEGMMCAFESLVAVAPSCEPGKSPGSPKGHENSMPNLLQRCRAALIQAASRKQHTSPAFRRLLELAREQGLQLETLMKC